MTILDGLAYMIGSVLGGLVGFAIGYLLAKFIYYGFKGIFK